MPIDFPIVPSVTGIPDIRAFPGVANIVGSIQGNVLSVTSGYGAITKGLSLVGSGIQPGTLLTSGLQQLLPDPAGIVGNLVATATVNISQSVSNIAMQLTGSVSGLLDDVSSVLGGDEVSAALGAGSGPQWGIFLDGAAVIVPDSFVSLEYKKDWHISDYPVEEGKFESYNKVRLPYEERVLINKSGQDSDLDEFMQTMEDIADSLDLYDVVTPQRTYTSANITHFDYRRTRESGVSLLSVNVWFQEVRAEATTTFTNTASPGSANQVNAGAVQTQPATTAEVQQFQGHGASGGW